MTKKPNPPTAAIVVFTLFSVALAGCTGGEGIYDRQDFALENHALILHPPHIQWDHEKQTISGNFTFSNMATIENITSINIILRIQIQDKDWEEGIGRGHNVGYDSLSSQYAPGGLIIPPGKTMTFNYTHPVKLDNGGQASFIRAEIHYDYHFIGPHWISEGDPNGYSPIIRISYYNRCLTIRDAQLHHNTEKSWCVPWIDDEFGEPKTDYYTSISGEKRIPPPEYWPEWTDDSPIPLSRYPGLRPGVEFLRDFDYTTANVTYYEGRIR